MKKYLSFILIIVLSISLFSLTACGDKEDGIELNGSSIYEQLNECLNANYTGLDCGVDVSNDGQSVHSTYSVVYGDTTIVNYHIEELNSFTLEDGKLVAPDSYKTTYEGTATYLDGKIISINGEQVDIQLDSISAKNITFNEAYFNNFNVQDGVLNADIVNIDAFIGSTDSGYSDAKVSAVYASNRFTSLELTFKTANSSDVKVKYVFK